MTFDLSETQYWTICNALLNTAANLEQDARGEATLGEADMFREHAEKYRRVHDELVAMYEGGA